MPRFPAIARASPAGEVAPTSPDYMLAAANYNKWDISRDRNRQASLAAIQDLQQTREQLDSAPTLNLPAPVSSRKTEVQTKIDQLDKQIRQYQEQEIADLREGIALLDRAIPLIDTAPIKSADKREHLREMPLERIQLRAELLMMLRARTKIPGHGGEPDLLGIYRTYSDRTSDAARSFAIEAEVKMRTAKKTTQVLIETAEIQALDLEASSRYLDPEIKLEHDGFNRWIRRCAETPLCVAHFHYDNPAAEDTDCRAAHLKTVAQERETNRPGPLAQVSAGRRAEVYYAKLESKVVKWILTQAELQKQRQS